MSDPVATALARAMARQPAQRTAVVATASPLTVTLGGVAVPAVRLDSYTPTAGDIVLCLVTPGVVQVLGKKEA